METPPNLVVWLFFLIVVTALGCLTITMYWCNSLIRTIRTMGLAASSPLLAAKLEQQRLRQQTSSGSPRAAIMAEIAAHQGAKARERHAQNRAAHPAAPAKPTTMRYIAPDDDLLPPDKPGPTTAGAPQSPYDAGLGPLQPRRPRGLRT